MAPDPIRRSDYAALLATMRRLVCVILGNSRLILLDLPGASYYSVQHSLQMRVPAPSVVI